MNVSSKRAKQVQGACLRGGIYRVPLQFVSDPAAHIEALTITPINVTSLASKDKALPVVAARAEDGHLHVPRGYGLRHFGPVETEPHFPSDRMSFDGTLRQEKQQPEAVDAALAALLDSPEQGGVICLPCGYGKTTVSLHVASRIGGRVLVLVHKSVLLTQWQERIAQFLPEARVGIIRGPRAEGDPDSVDIVIGMLQSIYSHDDYGDALRGFSLCIVDEAHHVPAATFLTALGKVSSRHVLGLSATPHRRDGLTELLFHSIGQICFKIDRKPSEHATLRLYVTPEPEPDPSAYVSNPSSSLSATNHD